MNFSTSSFCFPYSEIGFVFSLTLLKGFFPSKTRLDEINIVNIDFE